ncbi:MAG: GntR family transcriptional regulator, partial [Campylobacteraceae bacterium]|nr:GntR family transcriptional regulator [Campylobacteraceae bacterium]
MSRSNKENIYNILKSKIIRRELEPGISLNEKELMSLYGIGRTPLRDILMKLKLDDLVDTIPQSGTFVKKIDLDELKDAMEVRIPLEILAAKMVPHRITISQFDAIKFNVFTLEKQKSILSYNKMKVYTDKIHNIYYSATNNDKLAKTLTNLHNFSSRAWYAKDFKQENIEKTIKEWKIIEELIEKKEIK